MLFIVAILGRLVTRETPVNPNMCWELSFWLKGGLDRQRLKLSLTTGCGGY